MIRRTLMGLVLSIALVASGTAFAQPKVPTTTEEHMALAKKYQDKAEAARKEATEHREMAAAYKGSPANAHEKGHGQKNPWVQKMEKHCGALAGAADKLAAENQKAAEFHTLRAKELQGK